jgi:hypothetical protein
MALEGVAPQIELRQRHATLNATLQLEELEVHVDRTGQLWMLQPNRLQLQRFA